MAKAGRKAAERLARRQAAYDNMKLNGKKNSPAGHDQHRPGSKNRNK